MAGKTVRYYNLTGGLNTTQDIGTINQTPNKTDTPSSFNVELHGLGGIKTMGGNKLIGQKLPAIVTLGHEYRQGSEKRLIVTTSDGKVYLYDKLTNTFKEIYQFKTPTRRHSIVDFNQGIVMSNGVDDLVYYQYGRNELLDGEVSLTNNSETITGTDTKFTNLSVGDTLTFENVNGTYKIVSIESDTSLTLDKPINIETATKEYYAWSYNDTTYYTETENDASSIKLFQYGGGTMVVQSVLGDIVNGKLLVTTGQVITNTVTTKSEECYSYTLYGNGGKLLNQLYGVPNTGYVYFQANGGNKALRNGTWTTTTSSDDLKTVNIIDLNGKSHTLDKNGNDLYMSGTKVANLVATPEYDIKKTSTTTTDTRVTITYTRDNINDKTIAVATTGVKFYLGPISELNATYINSDDETISKPIRGLALNTWKGRLFVGGNDGVLYYSEIGLIHGWDVKYGAGAIPMFYNDNSDFTALGLYGEYLVIHRKDYTYYLVDQGDGSPDYWNLIPFADVSCESQQSWISISSSYFVYSRMNQGIYPLMKRTIFVDNYLGEAISHKIKNEFDYINSSMYDRIFPVYQPHKKMICFYMPMIQGRGSNYCYCYDTMTKSWWLRIVPQNVSIAFRFDDRTFIGTADGEVLEEFKSLTFNGEPIEFSYRTPWFSFGDGTNYLSTREFRCKFDGEHTNHFYVRNRRDGEEGYKQRLVTDNQGPIDSLIWDAGYSPIDGVSDDLTLTDTVWDEYEWVESGHVVKRFPLANQFFQSQQIEFYGKDSNDGIALFGFELDRVELEEVPY